MKSGCMQFLSQRHLHFLSSFAKIFIHSKVNLFQHYAKNQKEMFGVLYGVSWLILLFIK